MYGFEANGNDLCSRKNKYVKRVFADNPHKHNGFGVADYTNRRARVVLAFLAPILYTEKPHCITVRLANTVLGAFYGERKVNWGDLVRDLVRKLVNNISKTRPSPLTPFLLLPFVKEGGSTYSPGRDRLPNRSRTTSPRNYRF